MEVLANKKVLVTGATGFIGGRLAERLAREAGAVVTGVGRNLERAARLAEAGVALRPVDLRDEAAVQAALAGQEVVFHLAAAMGRSSPETAEQVNVTATEKLVRLAAEMGVGRFVHASSIAAFGPPDQPVMAEEHPVNTEQAAPYGRTKALGEARARAAAADCGLALAVGRPGMVYGPGSRTWSLRLLQLVQRRVPVLLAGGRGHAHPIYVDNLVDGLILAATRPEAAGQAFNFVDQPLPWREFFGYYGAMCRRRPLAMPLGLARVALTVFRWMTGRSESTESLLRYYTNTAVYSTARAEQLLDWRPAVSLEEGMRRTEAWLRQAGYLK
ncbi:MAG: NAD(P)-dependent oxidoreductase [Chloroflexi bacterium]|nr:NAD(P)-dependent oxidoreductase [Chloroflexota bacterium]MCI0646260.1 NAD(P)-dependent oxidoreductase [Chloroflexota bacterium]MCI0728605.1 NAD(P)-dependent oxidoreductase [Chloroflexota bacterium]